MAVLGAAIIGAGPAGLATAAMLQRRGVKTLVLERADKVAESWRRQYDSLKLHTVRSMSGLPGYAIPRDCGRWVAKSSFIDYLEQYAVKFDIRPQFGVTVESLSLGVSGWTLKTSAGVIESGNIVVATGANRVPFMPAWRGLENYHGQLIHASQYRNALPYQGRDVLVIGSGNTAAEILTELAESPAGKLRIAIRTPPSIIPRQVAGVPAQLMGLVFRPLPMRLVDAMTTQFQRVVVGNLKQYGIARPAQGMFCRCEKENVIPIIDAGFVSQVKRRRIECLPGVEEFTEDEVVLADGRRIRTDVVIAATGYRPGLDHLLAETGVSLLNGRPVRHQSNGGSNLPGLYFNGFTTVISGVLRQISNDAVAIADSIAAQTL